MVPRPAIRTMLNSENQSLLRLMTWLTPSFPTGAFAYSTGLESAYAEDWVESKDTFAAWVRALLVEGGGWNDAVLCSLTHRAAEPASELAALAAALAPCRERYVETVEQGDAFVKAARPWMRDVSLPNPCPLPVAVGVTAARSGVPLEWTLNAFLHAIAANQTQAAMRLGRIGQDDGLEILAALEPDIQRTAHAAARAFLDDLGGAALMPDMLSVHHETLEPRIFRS